MLRDHSLSYEFVTGEYIPPDGNDRINLTTDQERGGVEIADPSQGLRYQIWELTYSNFEIWITPLTSGTAFLAFTLPGITEASLAFDQNMNIFVTYMVGEQAYYYWYDPISLQYENQIMDSDVRSPRCCMDDKRLEMVDTSDILLAYMRGADLYYREERDRYTIEYPLAVDLIGSLSKIGFADQNRVKFGMLSIEPLTSSGALLTFPFTYPEEALAILDNALTTGWIDLSGFETKTFDEAFGVPVTGADFTKIVPAGFISVNSPTDDVRMYIVDSSYDANEVIMLVTDVNGNVGGGIHYIGYPLPSSAYLSIQKNQDKFLCIASDTGNARIRKQDFTIQEILP